MPSTLCVCRCGKEVLVEDDMGLWRCPTGAWQDGFKQCQGCVKRAFALLTFVDNAHKKRLQAVAAQAIHRCTRWDDPQWDYYGGRGIRVYHAWLVDISEFVKHFLTLEGNQDPSLQIDRINNDGHYEPGNLRFVTASENRINRARVGRVEERPNGPW